MFDKAICSSREMAAKLESLAMSGEECGGQGTTEYGVVVALVVVAVIALLGLFRDQVTQLWTNATAAMKTVIDG